MKKVLLPFLALLTLAACKKEETQPAPQPTMQVTGTLSGASQNPAVTTSASGAMTGTYDPNTKVLTYNVTYAGMTPTAGHFHTGAATENGPVAITFSSVAASPITGTATLTQAQADALTSGKMYANLHTNANPGGEIRANMVAK